ncbi:MAG TPA: hypothetical protein VHW74_02145 [Mycobacteriales bacterium]|nr:hypothetical protein [Mycobacteriales bacterium]
MSEVDEAFATALRDVLVHRVSAQSRHWHRHRGRKLTGGIVGLVLVGGGTALAAAQLSGPPGSDNVQYVASAVSVTESGTQTISLGPPPSEANRIELRLTCLSPGIFTFADGASVECAQADAGHAVTTYSLPLVVGQHSTTIKAAPGERWSLVARYADVTTTAWETNASGQTYGVANSNGTPTLIAAIATNGKTGYIYATDLKAAQPMATSPAQAATMRPVATSIPVYDSDGQTVIGKFVINRGAAVRVVR